MAMRVDEHLHFLEGRSSLSGSALSDAALPERLSEKSARFVQEPFLLTLLPVLTIGGLQMLTHLRGHALALNGVTPRMLSLVS